MWKCWFKRPSSNGATREDKVEADANRAFGSFPVKRQTAGTDRSGLTQSKYWGREARETESSGTMNTQEGRIKQADCTHEEESVD